MLSALCRTCTSHLQYSSDIAEEVGRKKESEDRECYETLSSICDMTSIQKFTAATVDCWRVGPANTPSQMQEAHMRMLPSPRRKWHPVFAGGRGVPVVMQNKTKTLHQPQWSQEKEKRYGTGLRLVNTLNLLLKNMQFHLYNTHFDVVVFGASDD